MNNKKDAPSISQAAFKGIITFGILQILLGLSFGSYIIYYAIKHGSYADSGLDVWHWLAPLLTGIVVVTIFGVRYNHWFKYVAEGTITGKRYEPDTYIPVVINTGKTTVVTMQYVPERWMLAVYGKTRVGGTNTYWHSVSEDTYRKYNMKERIRFKD